MTIFSYVYDDPDKNGAIYRFGKDLGAVVALDQDTSIPVVGEAVGVGDSIQTNFPLDFDRVREGSIHVFVNAIEVFNFTTNFFGGFIQFDTPPGAFAITADYNYEADLTFTYDAILPMTISGEGLASFNRIMNDLNVAQAVNEYFTIDSTTSSAGNVFTYSILVDTI